MTYEEAKIQIQAIPEKIWDQLSEPDREAMEMAFSALQAQEAKTQLSAEGTTSDLISRQDAIALANSLKDDLPDDERMVDAVMAHNEGIMEYQTKLSLLPSAQPEPLVKESRTLVKDLVKDTISRQEAIEVADAVWCVTGDVNVAKVWDQLKNLPSAQPEIVRCKDCKFYTAYDYTGKLMCKRIGKGMILPKPEDYCSYAERIADERSD